MCKLQMLFTLYWKWQIFAMVGIILLPPNVVWFWQENRAQHGLPPVQPHFKAAGAKVFVVRRKSIFAFAFWGPSNFIRIDSKWGKCGDQIGRLAADKEENRNGWQWLPISGLIYIFSEMAFICSFYFLLTSKFYLLNW